MKPCYNVILRPLGFLILLGISSFVISKLCFTIKQIEHGVTLQSNQHHNKSFSEIENTAVFSNTSFSSTYYTQPVNRDTGKLYGVAISSKFMSKFNTSWYQNFSNIITGHSSLGIGWNRAQDLVFSSTAAMDGRGVISIGIPVKVFTDFFAGIGFHGSDFHLAANDGHVLVETKLPETQIFVQNVTVSLYWKSMDGLATYRNKSCGWMVTVKAAISMRRSEELSTYFTAHLLKLQEFH